MSAFLGILCCACFQDQDLTLRPRGLSLTPAQNIALVSEGLYPEYFELDRYDPNTGPHHIAVPLDVFESPLGENRKLWPQCRSRFRPNAFTGKEDYDAGLLVDLRNLKTRPPWDNNYMTYSVRRGSLFPLPDSRIYRASFTDNAVRFTNVTDTWPEGERPQKTSLIISGNEHGSKYPQGTEESDIFGIIEVHMTIVDVEISNADSLVASVSWYRYDNKGLSTDEVQEAANDGLFKMPLKGTSTLQKGDTFSTGYRKYKVLNIVPTKNLPDGGHCEGWIELDELERPQVDDAEPVRKD